VGLAVGRSCCGIGCDFDFCIVDGLAVPWGFVVVVVGSGVFNGLGAARCFCVLCFVGGGVVGNGVCFVGVVVVVVVVVVVLVGVGGGGFGIACIVVLCFVGTVGVVLAGIGSGGSGGSGGAVVVVVLVCFGVCGDAGGINCCVSADTPAAHSWYFISLVTL
jgi:hypothetical protein